MTVTCATQRVRPQYIRAGECERRKPATPATTIDQLAAIACSGKPIAWAAKVWEQRAARKAQEGTL